MQRISEYAVNIALLSYDQTRILLVIKQAKWVLWSINLKSVMICLNMY